MFLNIQSLKNEAQKVLVHAGELQFIGNDAVWIIFYFSVESEEKSSVQKSSSFIFFTIARNRPHRPNTEAYQVGDKQSLVHSGFLREST